MNRYDTATRKGQDPREGVPARIREAAPGTSLDDVFASRYRLILEDDTVAVEFDATVPDDGEVVDPEIVDQVIVDETPPDAKRKRA